MKSSIKIGFGFGITSGIITTLGLIVGLDAGTKSKLAIMAGILVIAIADALSDALGIHIAKEYGEKSSERNVWVATISTFLSKFIFALTFILPFLFLEINHAVIVSIMWGFGLLSVFNIVLAKQRKINPFKVVGEHLLIATLVIILTYFVGSWAASLAWINIKINNKTTKGV